MRAKFTQHQTLPMLNLTYVRPYIHFPSPLIAKRTSGLALTFRLPCKGKITFSDFISGNWILHFPGLAATLNAMILHRHEPWPGLHIITFGKSITNRHVL